MFTSWAFTGKQPHSYLLVCKYFRHKIAEGLARQMADYLEFRDSKGQRVESRVKSGKTRQAENEGTKTSNQATVHPLLQFTSSKCLPFSMAKKIKASVCPIFSLVESVTMEESIHQSVTGPQCS